MALATADHLVVAVSTCVQKNTTRSDFNIVANLKCMCQPDVHVWSWCAAFFVGSLCRKCL